MPLIVETSIKFNIIQEKEQERHGDSGSIVNQKMKPFLGTYAENISIQIDIGEFSKTETNLNLKENLENIFNVFAICKTRIFKLNTTKVDTKTCKKSHGKKRNIQ